MVTLTMHIDKSQKSNVLLHIHVKMEYGIKGV